MKGLEKVPLLCPGTTARTSHPAASQGNCGRNPCKSSQRKSGCPWTASVHGDECACPGAESRRFGPRACSSSNSLCRRGRRRPLRIHKDEECAAARYCRKTQGRCTSANRASCMQEGTVPKSVPHANDLQTGDFQKPSGGHVAVAGASRAQRAGRSPWEPWQGKASLACAPKSWLAQTSVCESRSSGLRESYRQ